MEVASHHFILALQGYLVYYLLKSSFLKSEQIKGGKAMQDDLDTEMNTLRKEITDDLGYGRKSADSQRFKSALPFKLKKRALVVGGAGILLLLIILIAVFYGNDEEPAPGDLDIIQSRLNKLERKINDLEGAGLAIGEITKAQGSLSQELQGLSKRVDLLEKKITAYREEPKAPLATQEKPSPLKNARYHEVRSGETLFGIAGKHGISVGELCRLNNINPEHVIQPGQKLLVSSESKQ